MERRVKASREHIGIGCRNIRYTLEAVEAYENSHFENATVN